MRNIQPDWKKYERLVARLLADQLSTDLCITLNARVKGIISNRSRQLDALIDSRHDTDNSRRVIVDAKKRNRKVDVTHVEAFLGLMQDVGATHGYLVCPLGHTQAAEKRAQESVTISLVPLDRLENFDPSTWPTCQNLKCEHGRVFWDGYPEFTLTLQSMTIPREAGLKKVSFIFYVGKCDRCGRFHVKCLTCNEIFSLEDHDGDHRCSCQLPWFWLASIEHDEHGRTSAELHVVFSLDNYVTVDRRPA